MKIQKIGVLTVVVILLLTLPLGTWAITDTTTVDVDVTVSRSLTLSSDTGAVTLTMDPDNSWIGRENITLTSRAILAPSEEVQVQVEFEVTTALYSDITRMYLKIFDGHNASGPKLVEWTIDSSTAVGDTFGPATLGNLSAGFSETMPLTLHANVGVGGTESATVTVLEGTLTFTGSNV
jgi:hypothetical protein